MNKFEEMKEEIIKSANTPEKLGEIFTKFGMTPDNPDAMKEIMEGAGIKGELDAENAAKMVKNLTESFSPDMKKYLANLVFEVSQSIPAGPMPDDIKNLLDSWQKGGGCVEK
ncbi:MAG TPA: hypothetical protein GXX35_10775 [Thermoanaerobacterales bacterium]|nr:hypothetical protein [Thermoanaerobacterales bacterium]